MRIILSLFIACITLASVQAQDTWTLERCVLEARNNNIGIKQNQLAIANNKVNLEQNKASRYPNASISSYLGMNVGSAFDPVTYNRNTQATYTNNFQLGSSVALYQGGRVSNSIKQNHLDIQAAELDLQQSIRDIALQIAQAYLQILLAEEQLAAAQTQLVQTQDQLTRTQKLIRVGSLPPNAEADIEAQIARNEQAVTSAENAVLLGYINLKQLMAVDMGTPLEVVAPGNLEIDRKSPLNMDLKAVYQQALGNQPYILAGEVRMESAELGEKIARAGRLPTISASAGMNTTYSSLAKVADGTFTTSVTHQDFSIDIGGIPQTGTFEFENIIPNLKRQPYFDQLNQNLGGNIGVSISYPIWDNKSAKLQAERARLNVQSVQLRNQQLQQQLQTDIQNAFTNAMAAQKTYLAAERALQAQRTAYENTQKSYNAGASNAFELNTAQNNLLLTQNEVLRSKYDYTFRLKILDFYAGKEIKL